MIPRKKLDIGWRDITWALIRCALPGHAEAVARDLEEYWAPGGHAVATLSVRSGFDLLLSVLRYPPGTEILMSAVTIGDMARIAEAHGLVPVPVDVDMDRLSIDPEALDRAASPAARILLVAHLFGSRMPMEPLVRFARERGLLLVEDCAQAYTGNGYRGAPGADLSVFTFGPKKTNTARGGALDPVRDPELAARVRAAHLALPRQPRRRYLVRLLKLVGITIVLLRPVYGVFVRLCQAWGRSHDAVISHAVRSFAGEDLLTGIRQRPCAPLLWLLHRRLHRFRTETIAERIHDAREVLDSVQASAPLGAAAGIHSHWVVAVRFPSPDAVVARLWARGIDGTRGTTSLGVVTPPPHRPETEPLRARQAMQEVVYLPSYPGMPHFAVRRMRTTLAPFGVTAPGPRTGAVP
jgi:perosamine synthetase